MSGLRGPKSTPESPADGLLARIVGFGVGQPVYTLAGRETRVGTFYTAKGRRSAIGPAPFVWLVEATTEKSPSSGSRTTVVACLLACLLACLPVL